MCGHCGICVSFCPTGALWISNGKVEWNRQICCSCEQCIKVCPDFSSPRVTNMTVEEMMGYIIPLIPFISGITVSGGECTRQHLYLEELFRRVHMYGRTAYVDTNGQLPLWEMLGMLDQMDKAMLDVKSCDEKEHQMLTGSSCDVVLRNMEYLAKQGKLYEIRTVIVPELLNNERTVRMVSHFLSFYPQIRYKLIAYRPYGVRPSLKMVSPGAKYMEELHRQAKKWGAHQVITT